MQELMETYKTHKNDIEKFLIETITNLEDLSQLEFNKSNKFEKVFNTFPSLELIYICDKDTLNQISPNIYRNRTSSIEQGNNREYLFNKMNREDNMISLTTPYMSGATGETCITVTKKEGSKIYFLDFNLMALLQRLGLIEIQKEFNLISKGFYFLASAIMMILALFALGYSFFEFIHAIFFKAHLTIESIFKPIIAVTLGLAIFDLAKTVLEQEVVFKSYSKNSKTEYKVLTKFSITIIIALLIESLMVVFKIAISDYNSMINALYLISGVAILIVSLGLFTYLSNKRI